jgi:hypothetical protein
MFSVDRRSIEEYAHRDWEAVSASKLAHWASRFREDGWTAAWNASNGLLLDMRRARPDYPSARDRELDLAAHVSLRQRLDRLADAFAGR